MGELVDEDEDAAPVSREAKKTNSFSLYAATNFQGTYSFDAERTGGILRFAAHLPRASELNGTEFEAYKDQIATENVIFRDALINYIPTPFATAAKNIEALSPIGYSYPMYFKEMNKDFYLFNKQGGVFAKVKYDKGKIVESRSFCEKLTSCCWPTLYSNKPLNSVNTPLLHTKSSSSLSMGRS